jgi:hypothetical protein
MAAAKGGHIFKPVSSPNIGIKIIEEFLLAK